METDDYQKAWQAEASQTRVIIDADLLQQEVQRKEVEFRRTIFLRDCTEIGVAALLLPYWLYAGITHSLPWTWFLGVPALLWMAGFMLVYRLRHRQQPGDSHEPLRASVRRSLTEVEDQIWLLKNVLWWYLLPPGVAILAFFWHVSWKMAEETQRLWAGLTSAAILSMFLVTVYGWVYSMNQRAVRAQLEPRRRELLTLLNGLGDANLLDAADQL
ncbi:MAG: hypothetical protein KDA75_10120 [Planctomycetaceae bacterium]|nr:hypothetical protein [Planctomycetaceae bacterium]